MFEEYTYEKLMADVLENAPEGIDTRQGSIFYDAVSGAMLKVARLYADLETLSDFIYIDTTTGEYLDRKASEHSITRLPATKCCYNVSFDGVTPDVGERFYSNGIYFVLQKTEDEIYYLEAEEAGTAANFVYSGTAAIPVNNIPNLNAATFGSVLKFGTDKESDDALRKRLREKMAGPAENGNKQHYRTWCEEIAEVGRARIIPLWDGPNTVKGILISPDGTPVGDKTVRDVQSYIDPDDDEDGQGDGLGEGVANLGAHFTAVSAKKYPIDIEFNAVLTGGATKEDAETDSSEAITEYLKNLAINTEDEEEIVVRVSAIGAIINGLPCVLDYNSLTLNGETANIEPGSEKVATVGEVTVNVL